jgi:hypothetical protein
MSDIHDTVLRAKSTKVIESQEYLDYIKPYMTCFIFNILFSFILTKCVLGKNIPGKDIGNNVFHLHNDTDN